MKGTTVYFDLETGGVLDEHPVTQIAAIAVLDGKEVDRFERKILFAEEVCDPKALELNGYDRGIWGAEASPQHIVAKEFSLFLGEHADTTLTSARTGRPYKIARMGGFNVVTFDVPRLRRMMDDGGVGFWPGCWWYPLCVYQRAVWHFAERELPPPLDFKLQTLARHFGLAPEGAAHTALADVRLTWRLAEAIAAKERA